MGITLLAASSNLNLSSKNKIFNEAFGF